MSNWQHSNDEPNSIVPPGRLYFWTHHQRKYGAHDYKNTGTVDHRYNPEHYVHYGHTNAKEAVYRYIDERGQPSDFSFWHDK